MPNDAVGEAERPNPEALRHKERNGKLQPEALGGHSSRIGKTMNTLAPLNAGEEWAGR
jgi:hypothetical protein